MENTITQAEITQRSYLGAMLCAPDKAKESVSRLSGQMFSEGILRDIFEAAKEMIGEGKAIDAVTIASRLGGDSFGFISGCIEIAPDVAHLEDYAAIILEDYRVARWQAMGFAITARTLSSEAIGTMVQAETEVQRIYSSLVEDATAKDIGQAVEEALKSLRTPSKTMVSGWKELDSMGLVEPSSTVVIAGRPGSGKTDLSINLALNLSKRYKVYYLTMEETRNRLMYRILSRVARVDHERIRTRQLTDQERGKLHYVAEGLKKQSNLILDSSTGMTLELIRAKVLRYQPDIVFIDHCGLVVDDNRRLDRTAVLTKLTRGLKQLAMEAGICVVELVQLNRQVDKNGGVKSSTLGDLKGSGSYEEDANSVVFVENTVNGREDDNIEDDDYKSTYIRIAKNRDGRTGRIAMYWWPQYHEWHPADRFTPADDKECPFDEKPEQTKLS